MSQRQYRAPNLVLIGFMATGKSTIGRICARSLGYAFRDSDQLVERRAGITIAQIFAEQGESMFRELEVEAIRDLARGRNTVISTGGGAPMNPVNVQRLRETGIVVLLRAEPEVILVRCGDRTSRPLLASAADPCERIRELLAVREPIYRAAAHVVIDSTQLSRAQVVDQVLACYRERCG